MSQCCCEVLAGRRFIIETDHMNIVALSESHFAASKRCTRWRHYLASFDYGIGHVPGTKNETADFLSRPDAEIVPDKAGNMIAAIFAQDGNYDDEAMETMATHAITMEPRNTYECIHRIHYDRAGHLGVKATWEAVKKAYPLADITYEAV